MNSQHKILEMDFFENIFSMYCTYEGWGITAGVRLRRRVLAANRCGDPG